MFLTNKSHNNKMCLEIENISMKYIEQILTNNKLKKIKTLNK